MTNRGILEIEMGTLERAIEIAAQVHAGQVDKGGQPYILHPLRVMMKLSGRAERIVGVLHDAAEDGEEGLALLDRLRDEGFDAEVIESLDALTKRTGESRIEAAHRARANAIARAVKLEDNADNSDLSRIGRPTAKDYARIEEYRQVREILLA